MLQSRSASLIALPSFLAGAVLAIVTPGLAQPPEATAREFPPATLISGRPHDRGAAYGKLFQPEIRNFLDQEIYAAFVGKPSSQEELLVYAAACGDVVRAECPLVAAEFQGLADGAGLTFADVMLINLHEELYHRTALPKYGHCTAVAVGPSDSGNDHTYVGQTWDWMHSVAGKSRVMEWRRTDAASVLAYGFPGMPMGAGVSSAGIALCWTSAALGDKSQSPRVGIPSYVLIAHLLAQPDLDSVIREARKNKHAGWFTFVMADGHGNLVNLEGSPDRIVVEQPKDRLARVLYGSREMAGAPPDGQVSLHPRCRQMYDLLHDSRGTNDLARLQAYFADPVYKINVGKSTIDMMVFDTTSRTATLSRGTDYGVSWRTFEFAGKR